jgi:alpha-beta hydrolase superfamily lysophospholipase
MEHTTGELVGQQGVRLLTQQWLPSQENGSSPTALMILAHGYAEHIGRYRHVIEALLEQGYAVFGMDHRGHGQSEGPQCCIEQFDFYVKDLHLLVQQARQSYPELPLVIIGHSMGGLIATLYAMEHTEMLDALVLSGVGLRVGDDTSPVVKAVARIVARVLPKLPLAPGTTGHLSRDPSVREAWKADPHAYQGGVKARMGIELLKAGKVARRRLDEVSVPLLIMHGTADKLTNPEGSRELYEQASSEDKTLKLWDGFYHEIFNEPEKEQVIGYMLGWLRERVGQKKSR